MKTIRVKKATVLEILIKNRDIHCNDFEEALKGWAEQIKKFANDTLNLLNSGDFDKIRVDYYGLPKPISYKKEYEKAIKMVEYEVRDEIEISSEEFSKYFLDEWNWKDNFRSNLQLYKNNC